MHEKTADIMIQKYEKALAVRREFVELYDEIFEYCLLVTPSKKIFF